MILGSTAILLIISFLIIRARDRKREKKHGKLPETSNITSLKKYLPVIILILITTTILFVIIYNIPGMKKMIFSNMLWLDNILILILLSLSIAINIVGLLMIKLQPYYERKKIITMEKEITNTNYEYYRDIIKNIPPAILSYLYNGEIDISDCTIATILNLKMNKEIKFENGQIDFKSNNYYQHEKFIIQNLNKHQDLELKQEEFKKILLEDLKKDKYIYDIEENKLNITYIMEYFMEFMIIYGIVVLGAISTSMSLMPKENIPRLVLVIFLSYFMTFVGIPTVKHVQSKIMPKIRTDKGIDIRIKLEGLRNYLKDFTIINNMNVDNISLYNEYIIYAIIFNMKGKLNNQCQKIYNNIKKSTQNLN